MMKPRKPTRRDLLVVIGRLQGLIGEAKAAAGNDRSKDRFAETMGPLDDALNLCFSARGYDPPLKDSGPWSEKNSTLKKAKRV